MQSQTSEPAMASAPQISHLTDSLEKALDYNRELLAEMSRFTKGETFRFANRRLERTGQTVEHLQDCRGIPGLIGVQQEWLREWMQDYADQSLRYAELFRVLTMNAQSHAKAAMQDLTETARDIQAQTETDMDDMSHQAGRIFETAQHETAAAAGQAIENNHQTFAQPVQETEHAA